MLAHEGFLKFLNSTSGLPMCSIEKKMYTLLPKIVIKTSLKVIRTLNP